MSCAMPRPGREGSLPACSRTTSSLPSDGRPAPRQRQLCGLVRRPPERFLPTRQQGCLVVGGLLGVARRQDTGALPSLKINASALDDLARVISLQNILPDDQSDGFGSL